MDNITLVILIAVIALVVVAGGLFLRQRRSKQMRAHYGAEYIAAVDETGDRRKAEHELKAREKRVKTFDIRPLDRTEIDAFVARWREAQAQFVDDPGGAILNADGLLADVMRARGYPVTDFEQRAADLSVDHPKLVSNYRIAHDVADRHGRGEAGTEDLRRALIRYRELFEDLLEPAEPGRRVPDEPRAFATEDTDDERATRPADRDDDRRADDRAAGERRRGPDTGDRRAPHV